MKALSIPAIVLTLVSLVLPACSERQEQLQQETRRIVAASPESRDVTLVQEYVCQIRSQRHIQVRALERGYLEAVNVREGQQVKEGDLLFAVRPILYQANAEAENAEAQLAQLEYDYSSKMAQDKVVSQNEVYLLNAKLAKAKAKAKLAAAELDFATVKAPFDGIVDRLLHQEGSLLGVGETITTLSDNSLMWVYFNVPEKQYLHYMAGTNQDTPDLQVDLMLAGKKKFSQTGKIGAIEADFNNETGNIKFRADFPNPDRLLRHGQTGKIRIHRVAKDAIVIPQRAVFDNLTKRYVYVVDDENIVHQREIVIENELEDIYVIKTGLDLGDMIVLDGIRQIHDGDKVEYEVHDPAQVASRLE